MFLRGNLSGLKIGRFDSFRNRQAADNAQAETFHPYLPADAADAGPASENFFHFGCHSEGVTMQVKVYVPQIVEIPSEYLAALAQRACICVGDQASEQLATRGDLVRQAARDGLLRELEHLCEEDGTIDLVCDPGGELPLDIEGQTPTLAELANSLSAAAEEQTHVKAA